MKWLYTGIGVLLVATLMLFVTVYAASELGGEVVVLHRKSADGSTSRVRIWIVEDDEKTWVEHGAPDADWISMLEANPLITLERQGEPGQYRAFADSAAHDRYHELRRQKYGFADRIVQFASGGEESCTGIPVQIDAVL